MTYALQTNSESISLGGTLVGYKEGAGDIPLLRALTGMPDVTMYVVYTVTDISGHYVPIAGFSPTTVGQMMRLQTGATGNSQMSYRIDTSANAYSSGANGVRVPGASGIAWLQVSDNATTRSIGYNQVNAQTTGAFSAHTGWNFTGLSAVNDASITSRLSLVFNAAHDQNTRTQVIGWLAQKYGVSL